MSAQGIRKCTINEKQLINQAWEQMSPFMRSEKSNYSTVLSWCHFYQNGKFKLEFPLTKDLFEWISKLTQQLFPGDKILVSGFIKNPPNSKKNQDWHLDYGTNVSTILIPLVDQGCQTATQIIETPVLRKGQISPLGYETDYGENVLNLMDREGLDFMKVTQIVCRSHSIIKLNGGTVHRGIANKSNQERILFFVHTYHGELDYKEEPLVVSDMNDE